MTKLVPYLADEAIERDVTALLAEYARARRLVIEPPIPIEDIGEKHRKLAIEFDDTHGLFGVPRTGDDPDILGAMFFEEARIVIDESLDPEEYPAREGRYRFTLAHEGGGHWRLIVICSPRTRRSLPYSAGRRHRRSFVGQAKPKSEWSGRQISTHLAC
jgi:hypothetical protein